MARGYYNKDGKKFTPPSVKGKHWGWHGAAPRSKAQKSWVKNKRNRIIYRLRGQGLGHTYGEWELLKKQYNYTCPCCHKSEPFIGQKSLSLTEDHIIPLIKGGSDKIENIQPLCLSCNTKKHTQCVKYN
jgi:5-methylcytosine-specific restriction endonuclease McrA